MLREDPFSRSIFLLFCIRFWTKTNTSLAFYLWLQYLFILTVITLMIPAPRLLEVHM